MIDGRDGASPGAGEGGVRQEEDRIRGRSVVAVGAGALAVFFLASAATLWWLRAEMDGAPALPPPPELGRSKIGLVEQQPFDAVTRGVRDRDARLERLGSYGWVERRAGVVHIPIERAMELVARGARAAPAPPGPTGGKP